MIHEISSHAVSHNDSLNDFEGDGCIGSVSSDGENVNESNDFALHQFQCKRELNYFILDYKYCNGHTK